MSQAVTDRAPPHDLEAERGILGALLLQPSSLSGLTLTANDFHNPAHRTLFAAMLELKREGKPIDTVLLVGRLRSRDDASEVNWPSVLADLTTAGAVVSNLPHYATVVRDKSLRRQILAWSEENIRHAYNGASTAELLSHAATIGEIVARERQSGIVRRTCADVAQTPARLRMAIIEGLQREGETINVVAPSKTGKSWLALGLGLSIASGLDWLGRYPVNSGPVLYIDNELHSETLQYRVETVAAALSLRMEDLPGFAWCNLRGQFVDLHALARKLDSITPGTYREIILDAWYRFLPKGVSENDNAAITELYNLLDAMADRLQCGFICIHHSSKGNQSNKVVTDVGAGAGSQSRAADSHVVLRAHEEDQAYVLEAGARSFPKIEPMGVRFTFPIWHIDESLDTTRLRPDKPRRPRQTVETVERWTAERFAAEFLTATPTNKREIVAVAAEHVGSARKAETWLAIAESKGCAHRWNIPGRKRELLFANQPQPTFEVVKT
jgi:hypothetical protein